jgi:hypothetical protein
MTLYKRKWDCAVCGEPVYYDTDTNTLSCGCGQRKTTPKEIGLTVNFIPVTFQPTTAIEKAKQTQTKEQNIIIIQDQLKKDRKEEMEAFEHYTHLASVLEDLDYPNEAEILRQIAIEETNHNVKLRDILIRLPPYKGKYPE